MATMAQLKTRRLQEAERKLAIAEEILRDLAERDAPLIDGTYANGNDWCIFCSTANKTKPEEHDLDCPWRRAREYTAEKGD